MKSIHNSLNVGRRPATVAAMASSRVGSRVGAQVGLRLHANIALPSSSSSFLNNVGLKIKVIEQHESKGSRGLSNPTSACKRWEQLHDAFIYKFDR